MRHTELQTLVDHARLGRFHYSLVLMCTVIIVCDGYDLAVVGVALPSIMETMKIDADRAGLMVSTALFGMMFGSIVFGSLAERIGRRRVIAACMLMFSLFTALAAFAGDPIEFGLARFLAGIGIGGVMPNVIAQVTEYAPRRVRALLVTLMFSGYSLGGVLAALFGKGLIERHGWPSVFLLAAIPMLLVPIIFRAMPESMAFLIKRGRHAELGHIVRRVDPGCVIGADADFHLLPEQAPATASWRHLFTVGRRQSTVMFWVACFVCLFMVYALSTWLAKLLTGSGLSFGAALSFVAVLNIGGMVGAGSGGWLADRIGLKPVLMGMCALAAVTISSLGYLDEAAGGWRVLLVAVAGASTIGTQIVLSAFAGQFYPADVRSLGLGWMLGLGRMGAILAPILIGCLVSMRLSAALNFLAIGLPALVAVVAVGLIKDRGSARPEQVAAGASDGSRADAVAEGAPSDRQGLWQPAVRGELVRQHSGRAGSRAERVRDE